jgi:CDK inhibitor PHO81
MMISDPDLPPIAAAVHGEDTSLDFQAHKAAFFFKLERELEKVPIPSTIMIVSWSLIYVFPQINSFYLQKEAEVKLRLETLLSKRRAAALRTLPEAADDLATDHVEWTAVEEGFRLLERDLAKLLVGWYSENTFMSADSLPAIH